MKKTICGSVVGYPIQEPYFVNDMKMNKAFALFACAAFAFGFHQEEASAGAPKELSSQYSARDAKKIPGDDLLRKFRSDPKRWAQPLLDAAADPAAPPKLRLDSARAFVYAGETAAQVEAAANALGAVPFNTIDKSEWLYLCQKVAQREISAMPCARRLLREEGFIVPMLGGFDGIGKDYALVFLLLQMPEEQWVREIGDRLWRGSESASSQVALLSALFYSVSLRGDAIISKFADDPSRNGIPRARANQLLDQMSAMERNATETNLAAMSKALKLSALASEDEIREARRKALKQVSREALADLEKLTFLIRSKALLRWKERLRKAD